MEAGTKAVAVGPVERAQVQYVLDDAMPLLVPALEASDSLWSVESAKEMINDGTWDLWLATDGNGVVGAFLTELIVMQHGIDVNVPFAGFNKNFKAFNDAMKELIRVCKEAGYHSVRFISSDLRFGAFAKRHGFRRRFVEYVHDFEKE